MLLNLNTANFSEVILLILVIDKSEKNATTIADIFYYMGILSAVSTPERALSDVSNRYTAIIVSDPERIPSVKELVSSLREYSLGAPVFALSDDTDMLLNSDFDVYSAFDIVIPQNSYSSDVVSKIITYQRERSMKLTGTYKLAGIDASIFSKTVTYFDTPLKFTKTETMIIRYMISVYPTYAKAKDVLKFAFKINNRPELSNIRTHISVINKKFREITGRNLIFSEQKMGYSILTPIKERELAMSAK